MKKQFLTESSWIEYQDLKSNDEATLRPDPSSEADRQDPSDSDQEWELADPATSVDLYPRVRNINKI